MSEAASGEKGLTPEQIAASRPEATVWVTASAGTGKTHVLTARVLRLLVSGTDPERILCLTFTRAAAAEMAKRLRQRLARWASLDGPALDADIYQACGARADRAMRTRARRLFAEVLELADGLKIQTIHSFCQSLLGRFPLEAALAPQFEVVEEAHGRELLTAARDEIIAKARRPGQQALASALSTIAMEVNEQGFETLLAGLLAERGLLRRLHGLYGSVDGISAAVARALGLQPGETEASIIEAACKAAPRELLEDAREVFARFGGKHESGAADTLARFCAAGADRARLWSAYKAVFLTATGEARSPKSFPTKAVREAVPETAEGLRRESERLAEVEARCRLARVAHFTEAALRLALEILAAYEREKAREGVVDYDDLIERAQALLREEGTAEWILYKLDAGIDHVLVDEAQDTNADQWGVIEALTAEFFTGESAREGPRTLFAVGDLKQSIFSFQRADPSAYLAARDRTARRAEAAAQAFETIGLDRSFRSSEAVLNLVDSVFADPAAAEGLTLDGAAIRHAAQRALDAGCVELWPVETGPDRPDPDPWAPPVEQERVETAEAKLAVRIAKRIHHMLTQKELLESRGRPVRPGDILVLVQRRSAFMEYLVKQLKLLGVPVAGADRMVVTDQLAVQDLMAIARFCLLAEDDLTLATVLKSPLIGVGEDQLFALAHDRGERSLWARLREWAQEAGGDDPIARAYAALEELRGLADTMPPFEFFSRLLTRYRGREKLIARLGSEVVDPLDEFLRLAQDFEREHPPSLEGFLAWVEAGGAEIKRDMEQSRDEVRLMTVHGAKGLEAPVVFLPDTCQTPETARSLLKLEPPELSGAPETPLLIWRGNSSATEVGPVKAARESAESEIDREYRRLLYVALTRAEDWLIVAGWESKRSRSLTSWYALVQAGFDRLDGAETVDLGDGRQWRRYAVAQRGPVESEAPSEEGGGEPDLPDWARTPPAPEPEPPRPLVPSQTEADAPAADSPLAAGPRETYARGRLLHRLLELLPAVAPEEREAAAKRFLGEPVHGLDAGTIEAWYGEVAAILEDPVFAPLFGPESTAEAPISGLVGGRAISGQLDRLVVEPGRVLVVDYKTNRPPPAGIDAVPAVYMRQMAAYRALLEGVFPDRAIRCALLWTAGPRLMELAPEILARHAPAPAPA